MVYVLLLVVLLVVLVVAGIAVAVGRQPNEFRVTRTALLDAAPEAVFTQVNDLEKWQAWSPWARMDPDAKTSYEGPRSGAGAKTYWEGKKTGKGNMTIMESRPAGFIRLRLEFLKPMKAVNTVEFTFTPDGAKTKIEWTMYGANSLMGKIMGLFMSCGDMVGGQFEDGLKNLADVLAGKPA